MTIKTGAVRLLICATSALGCEQALTQPPALPPGTHTGWYVSTAGTSRGTGATGSPWDLQTALIGGNGKVQPGDTIWLRGGTYHGTFTSTLTGTAAAPIVVRQYPGERATIDGGATSTDALAVDGQWAIYWGFEIMMSGTQRYGPAGFGTPLRGDGVYVRNASNVKLINLIVHDVGHGTFTENAAHNIEIYGWIIYNGGNEDASRSDGHGIYIKNDGIGWKVARDNVIFNQFGFGIHGYAESGTLLKNIVLDGNVVFDNGTPSDYSDNANLQLGGTVIADNDSVTNNLLYFSPAARPGDWNARIGYNAVVNGTALVQGNYVVGGTETLDLGYWSSLTVRANTIVGSNLMVAQHDPNSPTSQQWSGNTHHRDPSASAWQFNGNKTFSAWEAATGAVDVDSATHPGAAAVFVRPNRYEPGRATIVVYNWSSQSAVAVDPSAVLGSGDRYEIRNVQNIFGAPVVSGTYSGGTISLPMGGVAPPSPIGGSFVPLVTTGPAFDVFILTRP
jgi:Right handed beta helix region